MEKANSTAAKASGMGNHENCRSKATDVMATPVASPAKSGAITCVVAMTRAVIVQMTMVSIKGSNNDTIPSVMGSFVLTDEWAIAADPMPASLENTARWKPIIIVPNTPPATPSPVNAPPKMLPMATGSADALSRIVIREKKQ